MVGTFPVLAGASTQPSTGTPSLALKTNDSGLRMSIFFRASWLKDASHGTHVPNDDGSAGAPVSIAVQTTGIGLIGDASLAGFPSTSASAFEFRTSRD